MLRIGFDAKRLFANNTGLGNYSRTLVADLFEQFPDNEYVLFTPKIINNSRTKKFLTGDYEICSPRYVPRSLWRSALITRDINKSDIDVFHGLSHELPFGIHKTNTSSVVSIHDLIYKFHPADFPWIDRKVYDYKFRYACHHAEKIIAISFSTKADIMMHYGVPEEKIEVLYQTCSDIFKHDVPESLVEDTLKHYSLPQNFLLYVGTINEWKNLLAAVKAIHLLGDSLKIPLLVVGQGKASKQKVVEYIEKHKLQSKVIFAPYISSDHLPALYQRARIFIFPSRYEGFGIPVIEALSRKTPVITTRMSSLPEAAGQGAHYIDPDDPSTIAEGILKILTSPDYYKYLINQGYSHIQQFNKKDITTQLMRIYERAARG